MEARVRYWLECGEKACCTNLLVLLTGDDVARIARALEVAPWNFTQLTDAPAGDRMGFALDASERRYRLALSRTRFGAEGPPGCTFLIRAKGGAARCGLGELRPAPCKTYPAQLIDGCVRLDASRCVCDWSAQATDAAADDAREIEALRREERARSIEERLAAAWNAYVATLGASAAFELRDYCRYALDRHALRA